MNKLVCQYCGSEDIERRGTRGDHIRFKCKRCRKWGKTSDAVDYKRLFFDIETSPNIVLSWRTGYKISIDHDNIVNERAIICIAYKWAGQKAIYSLTWDENQNDKEMLQEFSTVLESASTVVGHNVDNFDVKWVRTRCLLHGIPVNHSFVSYDTLKFARSKFYFNSNRLDYIADLLGYGKKKPTNFQLWKDILLNNDPRALNEMVDYCKHDVKLLENIWDRFMPYVPAKSSNAENSSQCPECGSNNVVVNQRRITAHGYKKVVLRCKDCGKYHTVAESKFNKDRVK